MSFSCKPKNPPANQDSSATSCKPSSSSSSLISVASSSAGAPSIAMTSACLMNSNTSSSSGSCCAIVSSSAASRLRTGKPVAIFSQFQTCQLPLMSSSKPAPPSSSSSSCFVTPSSASSSASASCSAADGDAANQSVVMIIRNDVKENVDGKKSSSSQSEAAQPARSVAPPPPPPPNVFMFRLEDCTSGDATGEAGAAHKQQQSHHYKDSEADEEDDGDNSMGGAGQSRRNKKTELSPGGFITSSLSSTEIYESLSPNEPDHNHFLHMLHPMIDTSGSVRSSSFSAYPAGAPSEFSVSSEETARDITGEPPHQNNNTEEAANNANSQFLTLESINVQTKIEPTKYSFKNNDKTTSIIRSNCNEKSLSFSCTNRLKCPSSSPGNLQRSRSTGHREIPSHIMQLRSCYTKNYGQLRKNYSCNSGNVCAGEFSATKDNQAANSFSDTGNASHYQSQKYHHVSRLKTTGVGVGGVSSWDEQNPEKSKKEKKDRWNLFSWFPRKTSTDHAALGNTCKIDQFSGSVGNINLCKAQEISNIHINSPHINSMQTTNLLPPIQSSASLSLPIASQTSFHLTVSTSANSSASQQSASLTPPSPSIPKAAPGDQVKPKPDTGIFAISTKKSLTISGTISISSSSAPTSKTKPLLNTSPTNMQNSATVTKQSPVKLSSINFASASAVPSSSFSISAPISSFSNEFRGLISLLRTGTSHTRPNREQFLRWESNFENLLNDRYGLMMFQSYLRTEFSDENIQFWIACEAYRNLSGIKKMSREAQKIYSQFLSIQAPKEVNLDSKTRLHTISCLGAPNKSTFELAQKRIQSLMEKDSYPRFLRSDLYLNFRNEVIDEATDQKHQISHGTGIKKTSNSK